METIKQRYHQWILGQIQVWDGEIVQFREIVNRMEEIGEYYEGSRHLREVEQRHHELFDKYHDLMLSEESEWDAKRIAVDAAAAKVQDLLERYLRVFA